MLNPESRILNPLHVIRFLVVVLAFGLAASNAFAQTGGEKLRFIRDAEIENYIRELATPIYRAADIDPDSVSINLVESNTVNAFVAEGMNEFFFTGLLQLTETPEQLAGVIAHETGHISGGHLIRGKEEMRNASAQAILGMVVALAAGAATGNGQLAAGALSGSQHIVERSFLSFSRTQESSADAAGLSFLDKADMTSHGMVEFFSKLAEQEMLPVSRQDAFVRTHPLTQERIEAARQHLENSPLKDSSLPAKFQSMHERMKAKLMGYLHPESALLRYADNDKRLTARYARAIALYRTSKADKALAIIDGLIREEPTNPYFIELKAQIQFENGRIDDSIGNYKRANELLPNSALLRAAYGHALLEARHANRIDDAIQNLQEANRLEERNPAVWRFLSAAWGRKAETTHDKKYESMATYALAEEASANGKDKSAAQLAMRAMKGLPKGSAYWLRAQDIKLAVDAEENKDDD